MDLISSKMKNMSLESIKSKYHSKNQTALHKEVTYVSNHQSNNISQKNSKHSQKISIQDYLKQANGNNLSYFSAKNLLSKQKHLLIDTTDLSQHIDRKDHSSKGFGQKTIGSIKKNRGSYNRSKQMKPNLSVGNYKYTTPSRSCAKLQYPEHNQTSYKKYKKNQELRQAHNQNSMLKVKYFSTAGDISDRERRNKVNPESLKCIENCENIAKKIKSILFDDGVIKSIR